MVFLQPKQKAATCTKLEYSGGSSSSCSLDGFVDKDTGCSIMAKAGYVLLDNTVGAII